MGTTAQEIAQLRAKTGLGMMECKKALVEANGDENKAIEILRQKGAAKAEKKSVRATESGLIDTYIHGEGKIGAMVEVLSETDFVARNEEFKAFVHDIALHVAAVDPQYISEKEVPQEEVEKQKNIFIEQVKAQGKPENIVEKIVEGKMNKYFSEICLLKQPFVKNEDLTIEELLRDNIAKIGENLVISKIARFELGK